MFGGKQLVDLGLQLLFGSAELLDGRVLLNQAPAQFLGAPLRKPQFILERPQASHLFLSLVQIALGARQIAQEACVFLKGMDGFLLLGGQGLVHGAQLGLQVLHLLFVLALVLVALLLCGFPEMLQRLARVLVLFFQGLAMALFGREEGRWVYAGQMDPKGKTVRYEQPKPGRNDPCPCGSGKKYKKCCGANA